MISNLKKAITYPRLVISEHNNLSQGKLHATKFMDRVIFSIINIFYPLADKIVAVSYGVAQDLIDSTKLESKKIITIHYPIPIKEIQRLSTKRFSSSFSINKDLPIKITVGRLFPQKITRR